LRVSLLNLSIAFVLAGLLTLASDVARAPAVALQACIPEVDFEAAARDPGQEILARYLSRRYQIAAEATEQMVGAAYQAAREVGLDPLLVLAVISVESRFNPIAESGVGAKGLMQIIPKYHLDKLLDHGGEEALLDPEVNIHVGAQILHEYYRRLQDQEAALQRYAGAFDEPTSRYAAKVFEERMRLEPIRQKARRSQVAQASF
jgi:soluble lytic murein transglycosylase-like protein